MSQNKTATNPAKALFKTGGCRINRRQVSCKTLISFAFLQMRDFCTGTKSRQTLQNSQIGHARRTTGNAPLAKLARSIADVHSSNSAEISSTSHAIAGGGLLSFEQVVGLDWNARLYSLEYANKCVAKLCRLSRHRDRRNTLTQWRYRLA